MTSTARQIRDISDASWDSITAEARGRNLKIGEYLVLAHREFKSKVRAVTPQGPSRRQMLVCSVKDCNFHTTIDRACPTHPQAKLKRMA